MSKEVVYLTKEKKKEFEEELHYLKFEKKDEVIQALQEARAQGDLSENADYAAAREEQSFVEGRINELETYLENVQIISEHASKNKVSIGSEITVLDLELDEEHVYRILGSQESDPDSGVISNNSPTAKALLGVKTGDTVVVKAPAGEYKLKVLDIK